MKDNLSSRRANLAPSTFSPDAVGMPDLTQEEIETGLRHLFSTLQRAPTPLIVLIDDNEQDAFLFKNALRRVGVKVDYMHFKDGWQAMSFLKGEGPFADRSLYPLPNLTVLDFRLTRSSGLEILETIRTNPHLAELVVVGLTASNDARELQHARRLGINDCINKPTHLPELVEIVRQMKIVWLDTQA